MKKLMIIVKFCYCLDKKNSLLNFLYHDHYQLDFFFFLTTHPHPHDPFYDITITMITIINEGMMISL